MQYRQLLRLATLTAFVFFIHTSVLHAQRSRNTTLYSSENVATGVISGVISGDAGPMQGARVSLSREGKVAGDVVTDATGAYNFVDLTPGHYTISCFKTDYRKRIINNVPVVELFHTFNDLKLTKLNDWQEERSPKIQLYEDLKDHKIEKIASK